MADRRASGGMLQQREDDSPGPDEDSPGPSPARGDPDGVMRVGQWTGVLVKGASLDLPVYVHIKNSSDDFNLDDLSIVVDGKSCKAYAKAEADPFVLTAVVPMSDIDCSDAPDGRKTVDLVIQHDGCDLELETDAGRRRSLPCCVVDLVVVASPMEPGELLQIRGNLLKAVGAAEALHENFEIQNLDTEAVLVTKSHPTDFLSIFVFTLSKNLTASLARCEASELTLDNRQKWNFIDTCRLGKVKVSASRKLTEVALADGVTFVFEPRPEKQKYSVNLHVGSIVFAAITLVGDGWMQWFSKKWVPAVAAGEAEEGGMVEAFAKPTLASLTRRRDEKPKFTPTHRKDPTSPGGRSPKTPAFR